MMTVVISSQGLGKTVQTVAFLTHLLEQGEKGPHIIVAPSSTLGNFNDRPFHVFGAVVTLAAVNICCRHFSIKTS